MVWRNLLAATFRDELPEDLWPDGGDRWFAAVSHLLGDPRRRRGGTTPTPTTWSRPATTSCAEAMLAARDELTRGRRRARTSGAGGACTGSSCASPPSASPGSAPVEWLVNRGGWEVGGGSAAVDATAWDAAEGYAVTSAPSMRMVVSLGDFDDSRWINLTGVSGHPFHAHYTDQTDLWAKGETLPWAFTPSAVDDAAEDTLTLTPVRWRTHRQPGRLVRWTP